MFQTKVVEEIETHFMLNIPPSPENRALYEIMQESMVDIDRPHMAI